MFVLVKTLYGSWQYVKNRNEGLTYSIYSTGALHGEDALQYCKTQFPELEFKLGE